MTANASGRSPLTSELCNVTVDDVISRLMSNKCGFKTSTKVYCTERVCVQILVWSGTQVDDFLEGNAGAPSTLHMVDVMHASISDTVLAVSTGRH